MRKLTGANRSIPLLRGVPRRGGVCTLLREIGISRPRCAPRRREPTLSASRPPLQGRGLPDDESSNIPSDPVFLPRPKRFGASCGNGVKRQSVCKEIKHVFHNALLTRLIVPYNILIMKQSRMILSAYGRKS